MEDEGAQAGPCEQRPLEGPCERGPSWPAPWPAWWPPCPHCGQRYASSRVKGFDEHTMYFEFDHWDTEYYGDEEYMEWWCVQKTCVYWVKLPLRPWRKMRVV